MAVARWTTEQVESFRLWHRARVRELYSQDPALVRELDRAREKFLSGVA